LTEKYRVFADLAYTIFLHFFSRHTTEVAGVSSQVLGTTTTPQLLF
jgi:hypothetical protein